MEPNFAIKDGKSKSKRNCSVVGCSNTERSHPNLKFYVFPTRAWEVDRRKKWIAAVRRNSNISKNKLWMPTKNSRICSAHFVGGEKSNDPRLESFNPTIFPTVYKKKVPDSTRGERLKKRKSQMGLADCEHTENPNLETDTAIELEPFVSLKKEVGVQTEIDTTALEHNSTVLYCWQNETSNEVSTQTSIAINNNRNERIIIEKLDKITKNALVGPDVELREGFFGFASIQDDTTMKQLAGITLSFFNILLKFFKPGQDGQPKFFKKLACADRLLLFLMKMKSGQTFTVIGCLFSVSKTTASTVFFSVLETLLKNTKTWIFWPSREAVKENMPDAFKNYPQCRAIIDCTELRCDTPPTVTQRVLMYSSYKGGFTVKYLVAISPCGAVTFLSKGYGGRATDAFITNDSGFLSLLEPGDEVMADKGFPQIKTELLKRKCALIMPPFAFNPQFTREEVFEGYAIASVRIHIERAIQRIKIFQILQHINIELLPHIDKIMYMACILSNNKSPIIKVQDK